MNKDKIILILMLITLSLSSFSMIPVRANSSNLWAVVVGVEGGGATHLDNDAINFNNVLQTVYGFPSENIILLTNSDATKSAVISALEIIRDAEDNASTVAIFISAHGGSDILYLYDATLSGSELSGLLSQYESPKMLVVINACNSGSLLYVSQSIQGIFITACAVGESTYDIVFFENTIFVEYFVDRGMSQGLADFNRDGLVSVEEAFNYAYDRCSNPPGALTPTHPQMVDGYNGDFDLSKPVHAPWFVNLSMAILIPTVLIIYKKRRAKQ